MDDNQNEKKFKLSQQDKDIIGEVSNISMGSAATALSNIMGKKVVITSPKVEIGTEESIRNIERVPSLGVIISYTEGVVGKDILIIRKNDAVEIVKTLMGGEMANEEFGEIEISAIAEVMNQMMGSAATALSNFLGRAVNISPPSAFMLTEENRMEKLNFIYEQTNNVVLVRFLFKVEDVLESDLYMIMTREFAEELVDAMIKNLGIESEPSSTEDSSAAQTEPLTEPQVPPQTQQEVQVPPQIQQEVQVPPQVQQPAQVAPQMQQTAQVQQAATAVPMSQVKPVRLASFDSVPSLSKEEKSNFNLIQDVPLELSVEVGKAQKLVKEVIDLTPGSIIELDKQAGDPVDVIVNGQLIAHGEVVVIDESFGVRITEIIDPKNNGK